MYTVEVNLPNVAKGQPVEIDGLGTFVNGETAEVSEGDAQSFRQKHSTMRTEYDEEGRMTNTVEQGPTLSQAFKGNKNITVKKTKAGDPDDENPTDGDHADLLGQPQLPLGELEGVTDNA
jgi:hypothetical protein